MQWIMLGLGALILLVLVLRFAMRPRRKKVVAASGLNLPTSPKKSLWGRPASPTVVTTPDAAQPAASGTPSWAGISADARDGAPLGSPQTPPGTARTSAFSTGPGSWESDASGSPADLAERAAAEERRTAATPTTAPVGEGSDRVRMGAYECPKCGGRFLEGEMEGPTLMIDGVAREDFQPLLTARECAVCGYLEFYTRPGKS